MLTVAFPLQQDLLARLLVFELDCSKSVIEDESETEHRLAVLLRHKDCYHCWRSDEQASTVDQCASICCAIAMDSKSCVSHEYANCDVSASCGSVFASANDVRTNSLNVRLCSKNTVTKKVNKQNLVRKEEKNIK